MKSYYKIVELLRNRLQQNPDVNTVIHGDFSQADKNKKNIYPLAIINPVSASFGNANVNEFTFEIAVLDQRDLSTDEIKDKFLGNDNEIDNLNMCHAVLNGLINYIRNSYNDDDIELIAASSVTPLIFTNLNILDGWGLTITVSIPNTISGC
jgi:aspartyl aminopeptidase